MRSDEIRKSFLSFFEGRDHQVVPSSSLVPAGDPTLFFTNAGMNQFKDIFTGQASADHPRAVSLQKCMRVAGKHNDFETVGRSLTHHTFFQMLGNFSFGDYFKSEAVASAWTLLTEVWDLDPNDLVVSVFEDDDEAADIWTGEIGLSADRVFRLGEEENYWSMGDVGPNGPCSEIFLDFGPESGCRRAECAPDCDCERYLEIWNLVFMQFSKDAAGKVSRLPAPSIDTGMGFERIAAVMQGVVSNYDTDFFTPIIGEMSKRSGVIYEPAQPGARASTDESQVSMRVIADHVRALTFLIADGIFPSNEKRGYVLRKLLRRAAGHAARLGLKAPVLSELSGTIVDAYGEAYPELRRHAARVRDTCAREEQLYETSLERGEGELDQVLASLKESGESVVSGEDAFRLYGTFGFPLEYTVERARDVGVAIDRDSFETLMHEEKERGRASARTRAQEATLPTSVELPSTEFLGYTTTDVEDCEVLALVESGELRPALGEGAEAWAVLSRTPFYAESGGQVGDKGEFVASGLRVSVQDTKSIRPGVIGHLVRVEEGGLEVGAGVRAVVDAGLRRRVMANHSATHLLQSALKEVLGEHISQAGSLVTPERLRFDFNHHEAVNAEDLARVEQLVNERVFAHLPVETQNMPYKTAVDQGATAMFDEKYGDEVRVVSVGSWSVELCGGTHCKGTEQIGAMRILSERGVASGVRRIEAVTGAGVHARLLEGEALLDELGGVLRAQQRGDLVCNAQRLADQVKALKKELDDTRKGLADQGPGGSQVDVGGFSVATRLLPGLDVKALREMADQSRSQEGVSALLLGSEKEGKVALVLSLAEPLVDELGGEPAKEMIVDLAKHVRGGGGGKASIAWAGGKNAEGLTEALDALPALLESKLSTGGEG